MDEAYKKKISKYLSYILRHHPEHIGLTLDPEGWANIRELIEGAGRDKVDLTLEMIKEVILTNDKQRFSFNSDFTKIRANQGHSVKVDLNLPPETPPEILFHGTSTKSIAKIRINGLVKHKRNHVHLSIDIEIARTVGRRHGDPYVLQINSGQMHADGIVFYRSVNGVWLTDSVPVKYIDFDSVGT